MHNLPLAMVIELLFCTSELIVYFTCHRTEEQVMYTLPCPVCEGDIGIKGSSTEEMVKHLEVQHKQQMCPICGRLFDMTLPEKYFTFHIEDHFMKKRK